jgi:hypothetical protein
MKHGSTCLSARFAIAIVTSVLAFGVGCAGLQPYPTYPGRTSADLEQYAKYWTWEGYTGTKEYENKMVNARLASIDIFYRSYVESLYGGQKKYNLSNDAAVLALSGLGTIGAPTFDKITLKIISATSGLLTGFKAKWDSELFYNTTLPTLIKTMNNNRDLALTAVRSKDDLDIYERLRYVDKYFEAGSLVTAINTLNALGADETDAAGKKALGL